MFGRFGFSPASLSVRDGERVWTNPPGVSLRLVRVRDLELVEPAADRPDAPAVIEAASTHALALAAVGASIDPITQDACAFFDTAATKLELRPGIGLRATADTIEAAAWWLITAERSCQVQLAAMSAGVPVPIGPEVAEDTARATGGAATGQRQFGPLYDWITRLEPDLLGE